MGETVGVVQTPVVRVWIPRKRQIPASAPGPFLPVSGEGLPSSWPGHCHVCFGSFPSHILRNFLLLPSPSLTCVLIPSPWPFFKNDQDFPINDRQTSKQTIPSLHLISPRFLSISLLPQQAELSQMRLFLLAPLPHLLTPHLHPLR